MLVADALKPQPRLDETSLQYLEKSNRIQSYVGAEDALV